MRWFFAFLLGAAAFACTIEVQTQKPQITIQCVVVELPGGKVFTECPDASAD